SCWKCPKTFHQVVLSRIWLSTRSAAAFFSSAEPLTTPQNASAERCTCLVNARPATVSLSAPTCNRFAASSSRWRVGGMPRAAGGAGEAARGPPLAEQQQQPVAADIGHCVGERLRVAVVRLPPVQGTEEPGQDGPQGRRDLRREMRRRPLRLALFGQRQQTGR